MLDTADSKIPNGQTLVQAAMMTLVFLAFMVIAIDMGHIYNERRRMQNAADAGALAGAYEICFGNYEDWEDSALEYAMDRNGAPFALPELVTDYTVRVTTQETVENYLAGFVGDTCSQSQHEGTEEQPLSAAANQFPRVSKQPADVHPLLPPSLA